MQNGFEPEFPGARQPGDHWKLPRPLEATERHVYDTARSFCLAHRRERLDASRLDRRGPERDS